jgi:hypothetical protein
MMTKSNHKSLWVATLVLFFITWQHVGAQRMKHAGIEKQQSAKPDGNSQRSINGGSIKSPNRSGGNYSQSKQQAPKQNMDTKTNVGNTNSGNRNNRSDNKVSVDNSKKNVNVNVDNSKNIQINNNRNTVVRHNNRPYTRPPHRYGGHSYYCHHAYFYHPYHPYHWGPVWHPWGFFIAAMATTAMIISIENQQYHYDQGVYYVSSAGGYTVVQAPVGATITTLPQGTTTVIVNETTNNYYYGGAYYEKSDKGYTVVPPTAGTVVENLPEGGEEVKIGDITYMKIGETYYQPIEQDGKNMYEVVEVKEGE